MRAPLRNILFQHGSTAVLCNDPVLPLLRDLLPPNPLLLFVAPYATVINTIFTIVASTAILATNIIGFWLKTAAPSASGVISANASSRASAGIAAVLATLRWRAFAVSAKVGSISLNVRGIIMPLLMPLPAPETRPPRAPLPPPTGVVAGTVLTTAGRLPVHAILLTLLIARVPTVLIPLFHSRPCLFCS
ncbi:unnamed protein product, partial [Mesorhabditis spiculigera]